MLNELDQEMASNLTTFIKYNSGLTQLDLSHCEIGEKLLMEICCSLSKSKSLLTLEITGNQGIT